MLGSVALEIAVEQQRGMIGVGPILGVQAEIPRDVIDPAISVKISRGERGPPPHATGGEAGFFRPVLETLALAIVEIFNLTPFEGHEQVGPTVAIYVAPQCRGDHADFAQTGRECVGHVLKPAAVIH